MPTFVAGFMLAALALVMCNITSAHSETIKLEQEGGVYKLPVRINDAVALPFIVDSGAAEVSIPADVFLVLLRGKTVSKADDLGSSKFTQADGTTVSSERFLLHKMSVGDHVVTDVVANVVPVAGEPLLGQSFLGRLPSWTFDNNQHTLAIGEGETKTATVELPRTSPKPAVSDENASAVICGQSIPAPRSSTVMVGSWQRPKGSPLCAGFVAVAVRKSDDSASFGAEAEYVYGKGTRLHLTGEYDDSTEAFTFHDRQGGTFIFLENGSASFRGGSGQLSGNFIKQNSSQPAALFTAPPTSRLSQEDDSEARAKRAIRICVDSVHRMAAGVESFTAQFYQSFDAYYNPGDKLVHDNGWQNGHMPVRFQFNKCMAEHGFPLSKPR